MKYYDVDYLVEIQDGPILNDDDKIVDIYIRREDHYCEETDEYWDSRQDESLFLKVKTADNIDKYVCVSKNIISERQLILDDDTEKQKIFSLKQDDKLYNHLNIYLALSDSQAIDFLNIMKSNMDNYDYNFQYCNQDLIVKNIVKSNMDNEEVSKAYNSYIRSSNKNMELESMFSNQNNIIGDNPTKIR